MNICKKNGEQYEPPTVDSVFRSIVRHLRDIHYPHSEHWFQSTLALVTAKRKHLVETHGMGQRLNAYTY